MFIYVKASNNIKKVENHCPTRFSGKVKEIHKELKFPVNKKKKIHVIW